MRSSAPAAAAAWCAPARATRAATAGRTPAAPNLPKTTRRRSGLSTWAARSVSRPGWATCLDRVASACERRARGERASGRAARALLRPRLRLRLHAGDDAPVRAPDVDGARARAPDPDRVVVGLGLLRVAHERDRRGR